VSYAYDMGLRDPRCNGCSYLKLKWKLGDKLLALEGNGWTNVYELDRSPAPGQVEPLEYEGRSIRCRVGFMSIEHSDECWGFKTPKHQYVEHNQVWVTTDGRMIRFADLGDRHLINILKMIVEKDIRREQLDALRAEARTRTIKLISGDVVTIDQFVFPKKGIIQRIKELL